MLFRVSICFWYFASTQSPRAAIARPCATGSPGYRGKKRGRAGSEITRTLLGLERRRVANIGPQAYMRQVERRLAPLAAPGRRKCVRRAGKSPNVGLGLHRTNTVGHDPEDQKRRPLRRWARRFLMKGSPTNFGLVQRGRPVGALISKSQQNHQNDALRQRGPPGPLARTHRG